MRVIEEYSHRFGLEALKKKGLYADICELVNIPEIGMARGNARRINRKVQGRLSDTGWALKPLVHADYNLEINGLKNKVGLTVQTGNVARAFYDLLKFEVMHKNNRIDLAVFIVPTSGAATALGSNIANFARITKELNLFQHIITVPCLVLGIDEVEGGN